MYRVRNVLGTVLKINNIVTGSPGQTLILAAEQGNLDIVKVLVKDGADVNAKFSAKYIHHNFQ